VHCAASKGSGTRGARLLVMRMMSITSKFANFKLPFGRLGPNWHPDCGEELAPGDAGRSRRSDATDSR
jgi:hypothetical protein